MKEDQLSTDETNLIVDLSEARDSVKTGKFDHALNLLKIILKEQPNDIDSLYLAAVSSRYLKEYAESKKFLEQLLGNAPVMGRAFQV